MSFVGDGTDRTDMFRSARKIRFIWEEESKPKRVLITFDRDMGKGPEVRLIIPKANAIRMAKEILEEAEK